jgi:hypothetical protein
VPKYTILFCHLFVYFLKAKEKRKKKQFRAGPSLSMDKVTVEFARVSIYVRYRAEARDVLSTSNYVSFVIG